MSSQVLDYIYIDSSDSSFHASSDAVSSSDTVSNLTQSESQFSVVSISFTLTLLSNHGKDKCVLFTDSIQSQFLK